MTKRSLVLLLTATLALSACQSRINPFNWFGNGGQRPGPATLEPKGGYVTTDARQTFPRLTAARWEEVPDGRLLVVTGIAPTKGWWDVAVVTEEALPEGRIRASSDGVLRLRMVGQPPAADQAEARTPADPRVDTVTAAFKLTNAQLARLRAVAVTGAANSFTLNR